MVEVLANSVLQLFSSAPPHGGSLPEDSPILHHLGRHELHDFLAIHAVLPLFLLAIESRPTMRQQLGAELLKRLRETQLALVARTMDQDRFAGCLSAELTRKGIRHAFFKGVQLRRTIYAKPWHRPSGDIDLLVSEADRSETAQLLNSLGLDNVSKGYTRDRAWTFSRGQLSVDLHWRLFRPGRVRWEPGPDCVEGAVPSGGIPCLNAEHTMLQLLIGTALGDYVTGKIVRAVDLDRWVRGHTLDWSAIEDGVRRTGLAPAGWLTGTWVHMQLGTPLPSWLLGRWEPGRLQRAYLRNWLARDPHSLHKNHPTLTQALFGLALYDKPQDIARALITALKRRWTP